MWTRALVRVSKRTTKPIALSQSYGATFRRHLFIQTAQPLLTLPKSLVESQPKLTRSGLAEIVYHRTYRHEGETWASTCGRVIQGMGRMQQRHCKANDRPWDYNAAMKQAIDMFQSMYVMKWLPPGRGLHAMGGPLTEERGIYAALNSCAFTSTADLHQDVSGPFTFLMEASMLGIGVGIDTLGAGTVRILGTKQSEPPRVYQVPDSREGWVECVRKTIDAQIHGEAGWYFDFSQVRPAGELIRGFGGKASGPGVLRKLIHRLNEVLEEQRGQLISITTIVDIANHIGCCVVSGNVRRTAEIAFGPADSLEYLNLKNYQKNPHRAEYGWTSNNTVFATPGMDYDDIVERIKANGEPGLFYLDSSRRFSRMNGIPDWRDKDARGGNPCLEQTLHHREICCLVETFPARHNSIEEYHTSLNHATTYAMIVTTGTTPWEETNEVVGRNRRIGVSQSGIAQFVGRFGKDELIRWCESGYDVVKAQTVHMANVLGIPVPIKCTSVKPSGSVSLLAEATPGVHFPDSEYYIRRVTLAKASPLIEPLQDAGYTVEPARYDAKSVLAEFPVHVGENVRTRPSMREQFEMAALMQRHWSDNQVSCTVTFDREKEGPQLAQTLREFDTQIKGISCLPRIEKGAYPQMPYETIDRSMYLERAKNLRPIDWDNSTHHHSDKIIDRGCDTDRCQVSH